MHLPELAELEYSTLNCICELRLSSSEMIDNVSRSHVFSRLRGKRLPEGLTNEQLDRSLHLLEHNGMISLSPVDNGITLTDSGFYTYISVSKISLEKERDRIISFLTNNLKDSSYSLQIPREHFYEENRYSDFIIKDLRKRGLIDITYYIGGGYVVSNVSPLLKEVSF